MICTACAGASKLPGYFHAECPVCEKRALQSVRQAKLQKQSKCKACRCDFTKTRSFQTACSVACALKVAQSKREQAERKEKREATKLDRKRREEMKTLPTLKKEAQREFNRYIRARDKGKACISCGSIPDAQRFGGTTDAGHFRSVGSAPHLRFNHDNCHAQCKHCNQYLAGNAIDYRAGLLARIGADRLESLEADQTPRHYTRDDLRHIRDEYRRKANELEKAAR